MAILKYCSLLHHVKDHPMTTLSCLWPKFSSELQEKVIPLGSGKYHWVYSTHRTEISYSAATKDEH